MVVMKRMKIVEMTESQGNCNFCPICPNSMSPLLAFSVRMIVPKILSFTSSILVISSILNVPGESTLRRDFQRLQQENKERSEAHKRQQAQLAAQRRDPEEHKRQLLHDRQKRIEEQKEQRRRLEEVIIN